MALTSYTRIGGRYRIAGPHHGSAIRRLVHIKRDLAFGGVVIHAEPIEGGPVILGLLNFSVIADLQDKFTLRAFQLDLNQRTSSARQSLVNRALHNLIE